MRYLLGVLGLALITSLAAGLGEANADAPLSERPHVICGTVDSIGTSSEQVTISEKWNLTHVYFSDSRKLSLIGTPEISIDSKRMYAFSVGRMFEHSRVAGSYPLMKTRVASSCVGTELYNGSIADTLRQKAKKER